MSAPLAAAAAPGRAGTWVRALALAGLVGLAWHRTLTMLWQTWSTNDNYSHGPLIPATSLVLVWLRREKLLALPVRPAPAGLALVALGCLMQVVGVRADVFALQGWALLPVLFGLSLAFLGVPMTRMLAFPIGYLGFMLTFPPVVMNTLSYALKEISVDASAGAAMALGVPLEREGMSLFLETGELRVEDPCSGLRSLLALLATGTLFAYFQKGGAWRRAAVLLGALPIAILGNAVRLLLVILAAERRGVVWASGPFHDMTGYVVYAVALAALLGVRGLLTPREERA